MSDLSEGVTAELEKLPKEQQVYFAETMKRSDVNVFAVIAELKTPESVPPENRRAAGLALSLLVEAVSGVRAGPKTDADAYQDVRNQIEIAEAAGDTELVLALTEGLANAVATASTDEEIIERNEALEAVQQGMIEQRQERYEKAYAKARESSLTGLKRFMKSEAAEAYFEEYEQPKIQTALARVHGV